MIMNIKPPSYDEQLELFGKHLEEFYDYNRGNQTYLDFLRWYHPEVVMQFTEDFLQSMRLTQAELVGVEEIHQKEEQKLLFIHNLS